MSSLFDLIKPNIYLLNQWSVETLILVGRFNMHVKFDQVVSVELNLLFR